jgi:hypothetical protein
MRLFLLLALALRVSAGDVEDKAAAAAQWQGWIADEKQAAQHARTRAELEGFTSSCSFLAHYWSGVVAAHKSLDRVVVLDIRHNWCDLCCPPLPPRWPLTPRRAGTA